jgi:hypothetical protein
VLKFAAYSLSWGGLLFDVLIVPGLMLRSTRRAAFAAALLFHGANSFLFDIHIFPWLMIGASTIFFAPDWPLRILRINSQPAAENLQSSSGRRKGEYTPKPAVIALIAVYCLFHVVWPFRHLTYSRLDPGLRTSWTEAGHFFSWRMMLRGKTSGVRYYLTDPMTGVTMTPDLRRVLTPEQLGEFARFPELIQQLADLLADATEAAGHPRPEVRALVLTSLNGRKPQPLVDPRVDLAGTPRSFALKDWIMPLKEPLSETPWTVPLNEWENHVDLPKLPFLQSTPQISANH